jgi:hypothetical protein
MVGASGFEIRPERVGESLQITSAVRTSWGGNNFRIARYTGSLEVSKWSHKTEHLQFWIDRQRARPPGITANVLVDKFTTGIIKF